MKILSHRGYWMEPAEKNSVSALMRSLEHGFGLETDIRDCAGKLVVSHDMPSGDELGFDELINLCRGNESPLALNIKADGLSAALKHALRDCEIGEWFVFDMSIPDMRSYLTEQIPVFARVSEVERHPPWIDQVAGIWFDSFYGTYDIGAVARFLCAGQRVCIVSPELHSRPHYDVWQALVPLADEPGIMICTDYPDQAKRFFSGSRRLKDHDKSDHF